MKFVVIALFIVILTACGEESAGSPGCVGPVTEKFTEYKPGVGITSGSVTIPTGKTHYSVIIKKADGSFCTKSMKKDKWIQVQVGDTYGTA